MPRGNPLDIAAIHRALWSRTDRKGRIRMDQTKLAIELDITKYTMSRTVTRLVDEKRLRHVSKTRHNVGVFIVEDPEVWKKTYEAAW